MPQQLDLNDLVGLASNALEASVLQPNILNFGGKPYPEQDRFFASQKRLRFISGGNRGGKSDAAVVDAINLALSLKMKGFRTRDPRWGQGAIQIRFVATDITKGVEQILLPKFKRWLAPSMLVKESWDKSWDSRSMVLTLANGSTIDFVTWQMDMARLGGVPRHAIYFDEEPPQHIFNELIVRTADFVGIVVIAATPTRGMGWTYDLLWEPAQDPTNHRSQWIDTFTLTMRDNPYNLSDTDEQEFLYIAMNDADRKIRESGEFVPRSGLVFPQWNLYSQRFIVPAGIPSKKWAWFSSTDHGWANPTAWLWHAVSPDGKQIVTFAEHYKSHMTIPEHAAIVHEREQGFGKVPEYRVGDPAMKQTTAINGTSYLTEYAMQDLPINVESIPRSVMVGVEKMQQYMKLPDDDSRPIWTVSENCVNLIKELKKLRWASYESDSRNYDDNKREEIHKKDDHAFDSMRYFATMLPDLAAASIPESKKETKTVSYAEIMARMTNDPGVTWGRAEPEVGQWQVERLEAPSVYATDEEMMD